MKQPTKKKKKQVRRGNTIYLEDVEEPELHTPEQLEQIERLKKLPVAKSKEEIDRDFKQRVTSFLDAYEDRISSFFKDKPDAQNEEQ